MTVPDAEYSQTGTYHEFFQPADGSVPPMWLEVHLTNYGAGLYTPDTGGRLRLNLSDVRILRDILTEHIARQDRKPA